MRAKDISLVIPEENGMGAVYISNIEAARSIDTLKGISSLILSIALEPLLQLQRKPN
jgi:hypothetical protein